MPTSNAGAKLLLVALLLAFILIVFPYAAAYGMVIVAIAGAVAAVAIFAYVIYWLLHNKTAPVVRAEANVLRKRHKQWDVSLMGETPAMQAARLGMMGSHPEEAAKAWSKAAETATDDPEIIIAQGADCYITFSFGGEQAEFLVSNDEYVKIDEGATGLLVYQGETFKHFIPGV